MLDRQYFKNLFSKYLPLHINCGDPFREEKATENVALQELSEMSTSVVSDVFGDDDPTDTWPSRFSRLDNKYRLVVEQKVFSTCACSSHFEH